MSCNAPGGQWRAGQAFGRGFDWCKYNAIFCFLLKIRYFVHGKDFSINSHFINIIYYLGYSVFWNLVKLCAQGQCYLALYNPVPSRRWEKGCRLHCTQENLDVVTHPLWPEEPVLLSRQLCWSAAPLLSPSLLRTCSAIVLATPHFYQMSQLTYNVMTCHTPLSQPCPVMLHPGVLTS